MSKNRIFKIMAIDHIPENLSLLENMLKYENYKVYSFPNDKMAINAAERNFRSTKFYDYCTCKGVRVERYRYGSSYRACSRIL